MRPLSLHRLILCVFAILSAFAGARLPAQAPPADAEALKTVTYDVADLMKTASFWKRATKGWEAVPRDKSEDPSLEALMGHISVGVEPKSWKGPLGGKGTIQEVNGTKLEITNTAKAHAQIVELLTALRRFSDMAVELSAELYEVDATFLKKNEKGFVRISTAREEEIRKHGKAPTQHNTVRFLDGHSGRFFSLRHTLLYQAKPQVGRKPLEQCCATLPYGVVMTGDGVISADRRFVRLTLEQHIVEVAEVKKQAVTDPDTGKRRTIDVPNLRERSEKATLNLGDGTMVLVPILFQAAAKEKGKVPVLLVRTTIFIKEEEDERKKANP